MDNELSNHFKIWHVPFIVLSFWRFFSFFVFLELLWLFVSFSCFFDFLCGWRKFWGSFIAWVFTRQGATRPVFSFYNRWSTPRHWDISLRLIIPFLSKRMQVCLRNDTVELCSKAYGASSHLSRWMQSQIRKSINVYALIIFKTCNCVCLMSCSLVWYWFANIMYKKKRLAYMCKDKSGQNKE